MDYLDYLYSGKDFNADDFNPDRKNEIGKVPIRNKKVALTGLSLGGIIMLPVRKERNSKKSRQDEIARKRILFRQQRMEMRMQLRAFYNRRY